MRRFLLVLLFAAIAAPAAVAAPLTVHAHFDDATVQFGEVVHARVTVVVDGSAVRAGSVRVTEDVAPLTVLTEQQGSRAGDVYEFSRTAACLTAQCVADTGIATPKLSPVVVTATLRDGRAIRASATWPALQVRGRVVAADLARARPPFRASVAPPPATYALAPRTLTWLLVAIAILLAAVSAVLAAASVRGLRRRTAARAPTADELERALRLAREAEARPAPDRRRAAGLLARLLRERGARLADTANELAWAQPQPEPEALETLVGDVERTAT